MADGVDRLDEAAALCSGFLVAGKQLQLSRRKDEPVTDQAHVPDAHPPHPGQLEDVTRPFKEAQIIGRSRPGSHLARAAHAVGVVKDNRDAACSQASSPQPAAGLLHQAVENGFYGVFVIGVVAKFVLSHHLRRFLPDRQNRGRINAAHSLVN